MLREIEPAASKIFICSDKKMSKVEAVTNKQEDWVYALRSGELPVNVWSQFRREKRACVMVWAAVASEVTKSRVVFIG